MNFPKAQALVAYHAEPPGIDWDVMLEAHSNNLWAHIEDTPRVFIAARIVRSRWDDARLLDPWQGDLDGDALHIYVAAGSMAEMLPLIPAPLRQQIRYFTFQRRGYRVHRVPASRILG